MSLTRKLVRTHNKFTLFYWKNFVREARNPWMITTENDTSKSAVSDEKEMPEKVVLQKYEGMYIGLSNVYDYIYRPIAYEKMSLYDWIRKAKKEKHTKEEQQEFDAHYDKNENEVESDDESVTEGEDELNFLGGGATTCDIEDESIDELLGEDSDDELNNYENFYNDEPDSQEFLPDHPQHCTHKVVVVDEENALIPNFVGGGLPRRDQGDREYYCSTMLSLFKPWRNGKDLKLEDESWDEAFCGYSFSARQLELMNNFNIKYECNDARDDYSAQMKKKGEREGILGSWDDTGGKLDANFPDFGEDGPLDVDESLYMLGDPNSINNQKLHEMKRIENVVQNAGWLDPCIGNIDPVDVNFKPEKERTGSQWNVLVQSLKKLFLETRSKNLPVAKADKERNGTSQNEVVVDDISYLDKKFKAKKEEEQKMIDDIAQTFSLNEEQERAFRIVANHATMKESDFAQLMPVQGQALYNGTVGTSVDASMSERGQQSAIDTGQTLTDFYSVDTLGVECDPVTGKKPHGRPKKTAVCKTISPKLQNLLWNLRHSASDHVPGKLSLCIGQEGHVVGWDAKLGPSGQQILETLFVKLDRPAKTIKIEGLPENVVPLVKNSRSIECICPSDVTLTISRSQVSVLPNFAMTDYASQGKTRPFNVVDLNSCRNHLSYYTALSRR
ncbi:uncharacterized protein LACBIDRAFT_336072 [Laccaria bicolor S238N-H82]|uniref:Predicted protein n=1 Tax=Laccaria bicolor (strain S238N-H82 / ATCC MYA-4686) TaxID=486041 RepID=B0E4B2_LACBS|nr:uncharacterized protein LACBIDRAFT_336072 [Laccaria bicolor S238N-H82]EDQ98317.1 predicted protein [Laccaria bicolor S238N-H82]|eukprot:XP_001891030.1 predicted protein [Laccaria bicolor S238N-H82]